MFTRDYIQRQIEQLKKALATVLRLAEEHRMDEARDTLADTYEDLLGHPPHVLGTLDPPSAARVLGKWVRIQIYAELLTAEAALQESAGGLADPQAGERLRRRALELLLLGLDHGGRGDPHLKDQVVSLLPQVETARLSARARRALEELVPSAGR